ncbi:MAG: hypothetical protein J6B29_00245 [Clostridia bacterium]|nr:hypothetical protein [Clostridia bacterium]
MIEYQVLIGEKELLEATTDASGGDVVVASSLSNLLVVKCLKRGVRAILTRKCDISSHAANILRAINSRNTIIEWYFGVDVDELEQHLGKRVSIKDDVLRIDGESEEIALSSEASEDLTSCHISLASLNLSTNGISFCYYPTTRLSRFAFSMMEEPLKREIKKYFNMDSTIRLVESLMELENAPSLSEINEYACDLSKSGGYYMYMLDNYVNIVERLRKLPWDYANLCSCCEMYYSTFLVIHRSYGRLFDNMEKRLRSEIGESSRAVYNEIMQSKIDLWLSNPDNLLINKKVFLQEEPIANIPTFSVMDDVQDSYERVKEAFYKSHLEEYYCKNEDWLKLHSIIFVLKEWKFVIYKIIFTHLKVLIEESEALKGRTKEEIGMLTKKEIEELL